MMPARKITVAADAQTCANSAMESIVPQIRVAIRERGRCILCLAGGSTPKLLYRKLAELPQGAVDWPRVVLLWGDERDVPPDHPDSNFRMVKENLIDSLTPDNHPTFHPIPAGTRSASEAAEAYAATLSGLHGNAELLQIDVLLLGIGDDAHTASLFPGTAAIHTSDRSVAANWVEKLNTWRITMTYPQLNAARLVYFLVCGETKSDALRKIWSAPLDIAAYPAQGVAPAGGIVHWVIDQAAADGVADLIV